MADDPLCPPKSRRSARGAWAEQLAADYLTGQGYRLIARNHRCPSGEVDLIGWDSDVLCFVEVRARADDEHGDPLETVDRRKISRIGKAARDFLDSWSGQWPTMRFDVVGIILGEPPKLTLVKEAFEL